MATRINKFIVKVTKEDRESGIVTAENLKKIVDLSGDKTWSEIDYEDTAEKILDKQTKGIGWVDYELINNNEIAAPYVTFSDEQDGEMVDLDKKNLKRLLKKTELPLFTFGQLINGI